MFFADLPLLLKFWAVAFLVGAAAYPLTRRLFAGWWDGGYLFSKAVGMASVTFLVWYAGSFRILPYTFESIGLAIIAVFLLGLYLCRFYPDGSQPAGRRAAFVRIAVSELFFLALFLFWAWVKGHEASIQGLEKFMDYGFTKSILNTRYFPPPDIWYSGHTINYYYFGHVVMATLTRLSGVDLSYTFNFMLALIFALTATMSYSIGVQVFLLLFRKEAETVKTGFKIAAISAGAVTSYLLTLGGNMQTIYAFTRGYTGEDVRPFWELAWGWNEFLTKLPEGLATYWYANATRFIPFSIHEFPSYSFVVSDVHGHVLSLPFALTAIALLIVLFSINKRLNGNWFADNAGFWFFGFLTGILFMTNALDAVVYAGLFVIFVFIYPAKNLVWSAEWIIEKGRMLTGLLVAVPVVLPFAANFSSFVNGLAVNCPPALLAGKKFGPLLFEEVEKCQKSPFWMLFLLWGFFLIAGTRLLWSKRPFGQPLRQIANNNLVRIKDFLSVLFVYSIGLVLFAEFFYFKDIYPAHFRSNTMFKFGYQAFLMFSVISGVSLVREFLVRPLREKAPLWQPILYRAVLLAAFFLVAIYPYFSVRSYFNSLTRYNGLDGLTWLKERYPDDYAGISWLNRQIEDGRFEGYAYRGGSGGPVVAEADGDSYTDYARVSAFTGLPTVIGWGVHEWLWRGTYDVVAPRKDDVARIYSAVSADELRQLTAKYDVDYIFVGDLEREKFPEMDETLFQESYPLVFELGNTRIYQVSQTRSY